MVIVTACVLVPAVILLSAEPVFAWGPVTHAALGIQVLATVITPDHPLQAVLLKLPEVFLYGGLAPDIVQGRRLTSRLRRHSHNWSTGLELLRAARSAEEKAFAMGYLAHLAADVIAHNFYLPACFIGRFETRIASHIYTEARFDSLQQPDYRRILLNLVDSDFRALDAILNRAIDSPLIPFRAHRRIFEGGIKRIRQWNAIIRALNKVDRKEPADPELFFASSCAAIKGVLEDPKHAVASALDPMGTEAIRRALASRRELQRLVRISRSARSSVRELAANMVGELHANLRNAPFGLSPRNQT